MCSSLLTLLPVLLFAAPDQAPENPDSLVLTILYDNYVYEDGTEAQWGFSALIEHGDRTILFDTGTDGDILLKNADRLGVDLSKVDAIVLSHEHQDHTGGLHTVLGLLSPAPIYVPKSFSEEFVNGVEGRGFSVTRVDEPISVFPWARLTGELGGSIPEQSLILDTSSGLVVVTGCSHPGIIEILETVKRLDDRNLQFVVGGFHLMRHNESEINQIIEDLDRLGVQKLSPTHCTGDNARALFKEALGERYVEAGTGRSFVF